MSPSSSERGFEPKTTRYQDRYQTRQQITADIEHDRGVGVDED